MCRLHYNIRWSDIATWSGDGNVCSNELGRRTTVSAPDRYIRPIEPPSPRLATGSLAEHIKEVCAGFAPLRIAQPRANRACGPHNGPTPLTRFAPARCGSAACQRTWRCAARAAIKRHQSRCCLTRPPPRSRLRVYSQDRRLWRCPCDALLGVALHCCFPRY